MQEGLDEREALDCFILDYIDYCTVMGWFERKDGCKYDDQSEDGKNNGRNKTFCLSTLSLLADVLWGSKKVYLKTSSAKSHFFPLRFIYSQA